MASRKDLILRSPRSGRLEGRAEVSMGEGAQTPVILIAGPTASGKSTLALELAAAVEGTIINADALQIYRDLRILSARPDEAAMARVPHRLYGYLDAAERGSAGHWRDLALAEIEASHRAGRLPIVVGGTGLYLRALQHGLAAIPPVPLSIRAEATALHRALGGAAFRERLAALDPAVWGAQQATRRYAKRQTTWFRHQLVPDLTLDAQLSESLLRCSRHFIDHFLLTGRT